MSLFSGRAIYESSYISADGFVYTDVTSGNDGRKFKKIISPDGKQWAYDENGHGIVDTNEIHKK